MFMYICTISTKRIIKNWQPALPSISNHSVPNGGVLARQTRLRPDTCVDRLTHSKYDKSTAGHNPNERNNILVLYTLSPPTTTSTAPPSPDLGSASRLFLLLLRTTLLFSFRRDHTVGLSSFLGRPLRSLVAPIPLPSSFSLPRSSPDLPTEVFLPDHSSNFDGTPPSRNPVIRVVNHRPPRPWGLPGHTGVRSPSPMTHPLTDCPFIGPEVPSFDKTSTRIRLSSWFPRRLWLQRSLPRLTDWPSTLTWGSGPGR